MDAKIMKHIPKSKQDSIAELRYQIAGIQKTGVDVEKCCKEKR